MEAKTKQQKEVLALSKKLKPVSKRTIKKMFPDLFINYAHKYYRSMRCNECGHVWKPNNKLMSKQGKCPHCKRDVHYINDYFQFISLSNFAIFYTFIKKYQIMRVYYITKIISRKEKAKYYIGNVSNTFLDIRNGKIKVVSKVINQQWSGKITYSGNMEIRNNNYSGLIFYKNHQLVEGSEIHPRIYKLGYDSFSTDYLHEMKFWQELIKDRRIETLLKHRQYELLNIFVRMTKKQDELFKIWKIHNRNNYHVDWGIFIDYIGMMEKFTKFSISNRKQIMPKDYKVSHNLVNQLLSQKRQRENDKEAIKREEERNKRKEFQKHFFKKKMYSFETFEIISDNIKIVPLLTEEDYKLEGNELDHCVYTNDYYLKNNSMCFSAQVNDKKMETIEVDLEGNVLQCRGYDNEYTPYHERLKELIKNNKHLFKNAKKRRKSYRELQNSDSAVS